MNNIGFIGYGHMGSVLLNSILDSGVVSPDNIFLYNRTIEKLNPFIDKFPTANIADSIRTLSENTDMIFLCTSTYSVAEILNELEINERHHLVFTNAGIEISTIEKLFRVRITRLIPTITSEVFIGYNILCHNSLVKEEDKLLLEEILNPIGGVVELTEEQFAAGSDLTSCAPAIISEIHNIYIKVICQKSGIDFETAEKMFNATVDGVIKLKDKTKETTQELIDRVATKGGSTEAAINVLRNKLPEVYCELLEITESSHRTREKYTEKQFSELKVK